MSQPLVSIISPTYNHEKFITDCIESVLAQTFTNWEMIIIDDGSTDSSYGIAKTYSEKDERIRVFTQQNIGIFRLSESYNFALYKSRGKYIAILECDDVWFPDKLKLQLDALESNPSCILSWGKAFLSSIDLKSDYSLAPQNVEDLDYFYNRPVGKFLPKFIFKTLIPALTLVIRKDALLEIGGFVQKFDLPLVDVPTTLELLVKGEFAFIDKPLGRWRHYPTQVTKIYGGQLTRGRSLLIQSFMKRFPEVFEENKISKKEIDEHFNSSFVISFSRSGRYKLIRKDFKGARMDYWNSIKNYGLTTEPMWKIRSFIGLTFSFFRIDVEWIAKLMGKRTYK